MRKIGIIIKELRKEKNCTQKEVADVLGVKQDSISLWENDKRLPDTQYIVQMAKFFDVSTDYLLGLSGDYEKAFIDNCNSEVFVTSNEVQLIYSCRNLSEEKKQLLFDYIKILRK